MKAEKQENNLRKKLFQELPYYGANLANTHGQFNNCLLSPLTSKNNLEKLSSLYHLDLFSLNTSVDVNINPDINAVNQHISCRYYLPNSFHNLKSSHKKWAHGFSILHNNVRSLKKNLESF